MPDQHVARREAARQQIAHADRRIVFGGFGGAAERRFAAGDDALHQLRRHAEGRRTFRQRPARPAVRWCRRRYRTAGRPARSAATMASTARAIAGISRSTASATLRSSALMMRRASSVGSASMRCRGGIRLFGEQLFEHRSYSQANICGRGSIATLYSKIVRYFLTGRLPEATSILLVESGSRGILEKVMLPGCGRPGAEDIAIDLVTCFATPAAGLPAETTRVYRVAIIAGREGRAQALPRARAKRLLADGHRLLRRAADDQVEMGAGRAPSRQGFRHQRKWRLLLAGPRCISSRSGNLCSYAQGWRVPVRCAPWRACFRSRSLCCICYSMQRLCIPAERCAEAET